MPRAVNGANSNTICRNIICPLFENVNRKKYGIVMFGCALESDFPQHGDGNAAFAGQGGEVGLRIIHS